MIPGGRAWSTRPCTLGYRPRAGKLGKCAGIDRDHAGFLQRCYALASENDGKQGEQNRGQTEKLAKWQTYTTLEDQPSDKYQGDRSTETSPQDGSRGCPGLQPEGLVKQHCFERLTIHRQKRHER